MYVFSVEAQDGSHMNMIGARGDCQLAITRESEILCALASSKQVVGVWPFNCLRRYWCGDRVFGFEAGKRSPRGEGTFTFISTQDEDIYSTLKQYIDKAKQATLQGKRYEQAVKEVMDDVNVRPKFPLPQEASATEVAPVHTAPSSNKDDESQWYELIPVQEKEPVGQRPVSPFKRGGSLHHTEVSGPSPNYSLKRAQTSRPRRVQQWVDKTETSLQALEDHREVGTVDGDPLPTSLHSGRGSLVAAEEDTYSHTQHVMPAPFQRHATDHNIVEESTYHTLVHDKSATLKTKRESRGGHEGEEGGEGGEGTVYSIAYPPGVTMSKGRQVHVFSGPGEEYGTLNRNDIDSGAPLDRTLSSLPLAPAKTARKREKMEGGVRAPPRPPKNPNSVPSLTKNIQASSELEDSMMDNPLYDSKAGSRASSNRNGREGTASSKHSQPEGIPVPENQGVYFSSRTENEDTYNGGGEGGGRRGGGGGGGGGGEGGGEKGYSKVDKNKKQETAESEDGTGINRPDLGDPPPVPPRLYEVAENELGLKSHSEVPRVSPISDV